MKKSKRPKEPKTFKRPRLYYQECFDGYGSPRMRIVYPDQRAKYLSNGKYVCNIDSCWNTSCWAFNIGENTDYLKAMREYDRENGWKEAIFLGEL